MRRLALCLLSGLVILSLAGCSLLPKFPTVITSNATTQPTPEPTSPAVISSTPSLSPSPTTNAPIAVPKATDSTDVTEKHFTWEYADREWTWDLGIPIALYDYFRQLPRTPTSNYSVYVTHSLDDVYIDKLTAKIREVAVQAGFSEYETVELAASFVQSLPYTYDISTGLDEYPRYPIETLVDGGGDCEDTSILMASILRSLGYGVILLIFEPTADISGHVAVGVAGGEGVYGTYWEYKGRKYYYLETTGDGWLLGETPEQYTSAVANIYDMIPVPILTHDWNSTGVGSNLNVSVVVRNQGSATATGIYVYAGFDAGDSQVWNPQQSQLFDLEVGQEATITLSLVVPSGKHTRLIVQIVDDGIAVDDSQSEWFDS
jgi:hypothetical protein